MATKAPTARELALAALLHRAIPGVVTGRKAVLGIGDAGAVHDLRRALRRVRVLLRLLHQTTPSPLLAGLRATAREMASALGPVRAWDAFLGETLPLANSHGLDVATSTRIANAAQEPRAAALQTARDTLRRRPMQDFGRRLGVAAPPGPADVSPGTANAILGALHRRTLIRGRSLRSLDADARHRLRLAGKALADAAALIAPHHPIRRRALRRLAFVTKAIGSARDRDTARTLAAQFADPHTGAALHHALDAAAKGQERKLRRNWRAYRRAPNPHTRHKKTAG